MSWCGRLTLRFAADRGRTYIAERVHSGPLLVQRAFYPEAAAARDAAGCEPCHVYLIHPPGGVASGDDLQLEATVGPGSHAVLTTPAAGKFYRRGSASEARMCQLLHIEGTLEWLPQENIFFPDTAAAVATIVRLAPHGRFIGWEIGCFGLPAHRRSLEAGTVRQRFELWRDGSPLYVERLTIDEESRLAAWGLGGRTSSGTLIGYRAGAEELAVARREASRLGCAELIVACTLVDEVLMCRAVALHADRLKAAFIELWRALRPALIGREAVLPRVWAT